MLDTSHELYTSNYSNSLGDYIWQRSAASLVFAEWVFLSYVASMQW